MSAGLRIIEAGEADAARWDAYVEERGSFFHLFGWRRVIARAYGYDASYLMAVRDGKVAGVLPLVDVKSPLFGRNLISTAFTVGGGLVADDAAAAQALAEAAVEQGKRRRAGYVELRGAPAPLGGWIVKRGVYAGFEFILPTDESENLNRIPRRRRAEVRKAEAALAAGALNADFDGDEAAFYTLYAEAMRDHGTPVFSRVFLAALMTEFAGRVEILTLRKERAPILALLSFYFGDRVMPYYVGGRGEARALRAYDLAYWLQMRRAALKGAAVFDFGRSKYGSGSFDYKKYWGAEPRPLDYHYALLKARATPNVSPANPRYRAAVSAWRRLPLGLANRAGPVLARHIA